MGLRQPVPVLIFPIDLIYYILNRGIASAANVQAAVPDRLLSEIATRLKGARMARPDSAQFNALLFARLSNHETWCKRQF